MTRKLAWLGMVALWLTAAGASSAETIAITGGTVHTMTSAGTLKQATVLVENGRISEVGADIDIPEDATVIDASGKVVTPGLFSAFTSIGLVEIGMVKETVDFHGPEAAFGPGFDVSVAVNPNSTLIPVTRIEGVTRVLTLPEASHSLFAGQGAVLHLGGGEDTVAKPRAAMLVEVGEEGAEIAGGSRAAVWLALREALDDARDFDANREGYQAGRHRPYSLGRVDLEALIPVLKGEMPLLLHLNRVADIRQALRLARDYDVRVVLLEAQEAWLLADELAAANIAVIINPLDNLPDRFEGIAAALESAARLQSAGVTIAFGSFNFASHNARLVAQLAGNAAANGLPWKAALEALTVNPARIFGLEDSYGAIRPGLDADIVIWNGDPLEVMTAPEAVLIKGQRVPAESRQTKLRDRYLNLLEDGAPFAYR